MGEDDPSFLWERGSLSEKPTHMHTFTARFCLVKERVLILPDFFRILEHVEQWNKILLQILAYKMIHVVNNDAGDLSTAFHLGRFICQGP